MATNTKLAALPNIIHYPLDQATKLSTAGSIHNPNATYNSATHSLTPFDYSRPSLQFSPKNKTIRFNVSDFGIVTIQLDRSKQINALNLDLVEDMYDILQFLFQNEEYYRAVILTSTSQNFCAGLDIASVMGMSPPPKPKDSQSPVVKRNGMKELLTQYNPAHTTYSDYNFDTLPDPITSPPTAIKFTNHNIIQHLCIGWQILSIPVISIINGITFGAGFQLILGADIRLATQTAKCSILESKWGLIPDMGLTGLGRGIIREDQLKFLAYSAQVVTGNDILKYNISTYPTIFENLTELSTILNQFLTNIIFKPPQTIRNIKKVMNQTTPFHHSIPHLWSYTRPENGRRIHFEPFDNNHKISNFNIEQILQADLLRDPNQKIIVSSNLQGKLPVYVLEVVSGSVSSVGGLNMTVSPVPAGGNNRIGDDMGSVPTTQQQARL